MKQKRVRVKNKVDHSVTDQGVFGDSTSLLDHHGTELGVLRMESKGRSPKETSMIWYVSYESKVRTCGVLTSLELRVHRLELVTFSL